MFSEPQYQNGWLAFLEFFTEFHKTLYKMVSAFFIIVSSSLFLKEQVWSKVTHFYEKYVKIIFFKTSEV